jgi:hypothetical protein
LLILRNHHYIIIFNGKKINYSLENFFSNFFPFSGDFLKLPRVRNAMEKSIFVLFSNSLKHIHPESQSQSNKQTNEENYGLCGEKRNDGKFQRKSNLIGFFVQFFWWLGITLSLVF